MPKKPTFDFCRQSPFKTLALPDPIRDHVVHRTQWSSKGLPTRLRFSTRQPSSPTAVRIEKLYHPKLFQRAVPITYIARFIPGATAHRLKVTLEPGQTPWLLPPSLGLTEHDLKAIVRKLIRPEFKRGRVINHELTYTRRGPRGIVVMKLKKPHRTRSK